MTPSPPQSGLSKVDRRRGAVIPSRPGHKPIQRIKTMLCPKCSQPVADRARFCGSCGEPMTVAGNDASVTPPPRGPVGGAGTAAARRIDRIKKIILSPKTEWPVIETEPTTTAQLYRGYVIPLVAFSALMSFVRLSIVGIGFWRMPVLTGLAYALVSFAFG